MTTLNLDEGFRGSIHTYLLSAEYSTLSYISPLRPEDLLATTLNLYEGFRGSLPI